MKIVWRIRSMYPNLDPEMDTQMDAILGEGDCNEK